MPRKVLRRDTRGEMRSVTVSYQRVDIPLVTSRVGYGKTYSDALRDADSQLSDGTWRRLAVSNPNSILTDIATTNAARFARGTLRRGEGTVIRVEKRISEVLDVE